MKCKIILIICLVCGALNTFGQPIGFSYDSNGNRTKRKLVVEQTSRNKISFPITDPNMIKTLTSKEANAKAQSIQESGGDLNVTVYPNPNKGLLKVDLINAPNASKNELILYDLSGKVLMEKKNFDDYLELDLSSVKDGIYILRILINEQVFNWKIIKSDS